MTNIQNIDNKECFNKIKFPLKIRGILKIKKIKKKKKRKHSIGISLFGYEKHSIYVSKECYEEKHFDLLWIGEKGKIHYVLIKDFNTFMYDNILHHGKYIFAVIFYRLLVQKKY